MDSITLTFHSDPGHGWLAVPHRLFKMLGSPRLSRYSYVGPAEVFAEEDCDAQIILEILKVRGITYKLNEVVTDEDSFIRRLPRLVIEDMVPAAEQRHQAHVAASRLIEDTDEETCKPSAPLYVNPVHGEEEDAADARPGMYPTFT